MKIYERLQILCKERNTTITQVARELKISTSMPTAWKKGICPSAETIVKLADYFDCSTDYILRDKPSTVDEYEGLLEFKNLTAEQQELLMYFNEIGERLGSEAQKALITYAKFVAEGSK